MCRFVLFYWAMKNDAKKRTSKTAFVLALPPTTPASEVAAKAKAAGFVISEAYVYTIRSQARAKAATSKDGRPKLGRPARHGSPGWDGSVEGRFVDAALDLGLARAEELLTRLRAKVKGIVL